MISSEFAHPLALREDIFILIPFIIDRKRLLWYNINMRISEPKQNYRTIKCVHILIMTILYIALIGVLVKVIGEPSRTAAAFLVDVFCYDEMLRVTCLYYERLRKQNKS